MLSVITAPQAEPISLAEAKAHLRIEADVVIEDELIQLLIQAAREQAQHETGRALITQGLQMLEPATCRIRLCRPPLQEITSVVALDEDGAETAVDATDYRIDETGLLPVLVIKTMPADALHVRVQYTAGYGEARTDVPAAIRRWMLLHISTHYEHRESVVVGSSVATMPTPFIDGLLDPFRASSGF